MTKKKVKKISRRFIKDEVISKTLYVEHVFRKVTGLGKRGVEVIKLPGGGQILPYFNDKKGIWKVVLISQYRPALKKTIIEAAGGRIDKGEMPQKTLSRELKEETGIIVKPQSIRIVLEEYSLPSLLDAQMVGGIVQIEAGEVENKKIAGNNHERERTRVEIFQLTELLKNHQNRIIKLDLLTSRLLDEVAKATKILLKKY